MDNTVMINRDVNIIAYYFRGKDKPNCFPKRMVHVFDMTDGKADYRLEFDAEVLSWKLVAVSDAQNAFAN